DGATLGDIRINGTEFYNNVKDIISGTATSHADSCIINNCYFHNNSRSAVYFVASSVSGVETCDGVIVKNSTFANNDLSASSRSVIDVQNYGGTEAANIEVTVDHCTFYNNTTVNYDYSCVRSKKSTKVSITNSIFAYPSAIEFYATNCYGGTISNNLVYNLNKGHRSSDGAPAITNAITGNPHFTDAANGDFSLACNWATGPVSPARDAATDGSNLGDPRWYAAENIPSTSFASAYNLIGTTAWLNGDIELNASDHIKYKGTSTPGTAKWKLHVGRVCDIKAVVDREAGNTSGCKLTLTVKDADGNDVGALAATSGSYNDNDIELPGTISFPAEGDYTFILTNSTANSGSILEKIILTYVGGAVQEMPGTTDINDALFSSNGTRTGGAIEYSSVGSGCWAKWNISVTDDAWYDVTANIKGQYGHDITVEFFEAGNATPVATAAEGGTVYDNDLTLYPAALGLVHLEAGDYEMKFSNSVGDAALISIVLAYAGGNVINISPSANTTLNVADAWFTSSCIREDGKIEYHTDHANAWVKWNIATSATAFYDIEVNIETTNAHEFAVNIYEDENVSPVATVSEEYNSANGTLELGRVNLIGGKNFVVKVTNITSGSKAKLVSVVFKPVVSSAITLPGTIDFSKATLSDLAFTQDGKLYFNEIGDSNPVGQWAQWEVTTDHAGTFLFTMEVSSSNSQSYKITIFDAVMNEVAEFEKNPDGSGDKTLTHYFYLGAGNYFVKVENTHTWSQGHLVRLVVTEPEILSLNQTAEDNSVLTTYERKDAQPIQIIRTFIGKTFNTISLPFDVNSTQLKDIFGSGVKLKELTSSAFDAESSILDLNFTEVTSIYRGTPYLIKPEIDIVNPVFEDAVIKATAGDATASDYVDFYGTLIASEVPAGEYNLFLGPNNLLYFSPDDATPIKGFRGWFVVHNIDGGAHVIQRARIVEQEEEITAVELVNSENNSRKVIENGQLIIIRDGVRYNVMGIVIEK
ncbi:MAG: DUF5123 domain-containing protein, partial [Paludibacteraceae bacterium]|nr:DUF5123 domain-containing protein [Paludibacteraceae bacterium]